MKLKETTKEKRKEITSKINEFSPKKHATALGPHPRFENTPQISGPQSTPTALKTRQTTPSNQTTRPFKL